jgi:DNA polymerase III alpha subunit
MHPCGVVVSRQPIHELTPTFIANKGYSTTHFDMDAVEVIGLVKSGHAGAGRIGGHA